MEWPRPLKKTENRLKVYDLFLHSPEALSVEDLHQALPTIHLATLYRIVEDFEKVAFIRLTDDFNPKQKRYQLKELGHRHSIKCVVCGKQEALESCPVHIHAPKGFVILNHRLEVEGLCEHCAKAHKGTL